MYVFDLDGTLVDSVEAHVSAWIEALNLLGVNVNIGDVKILMGLPAVEIAKRLLPERATELATLKNEIFLEKYINFVTLYKDAEVVKYLSRPIAIVTSSSGNVARAIVEKFDISRYIDLVLGGDEVERGKPAPDPLYVVAKHLNTSTRDMVVVGDSDYDMEMAEAAGAYGVCIVRHKRCTKARRYIDDLRQLL